MLICLFSIALEPAYGNIDKNVRVFVSKAIYVFLFRYQNRLVGLIVSILLLQLNQVFIRERVDDNAKEDKGLKVEIEAIYGKGHKVRNC